MALSLVWQAFTPISSQGHRRELGKRPTNRGSAGEPGGGVTGRHGGAMRAERASDHGAASQSVLMSVYRTPKLRGLDPTKTITDALKTYLTTGRLPQLPG